MEVKGYKAFNVDKTNRYGIPFLEGETYKVTGSISFGNEGNGFHMCTSLCDVFRYFDYSSDEVCVAEVIGRGNHRVYNDEYNGYFDMYAVEEITIIRYLSREEIIALMLNDYDFNNRKFLMTFKLTEEEKDRYLRKYRHNYAMMEWLLFYQYDFKRIYDSSFEERKEQIRKVLESGQDNN